MAAARIPFPERFPRLTAAMTAFALLVITSAITVVAGIEYLRGAGFYWR
jgi:hypothetical protein